MTPAETILLIVAVVFLLANLLFLVFFVRVFRLWLRAFLSGARISILNLLMMMFRRSPVDEIVRLKIMATQAGVDLPTNRIESAALAGANVERAVLALIRAREVGADVTWEELISQDMSDRLRNELFPPTDPEQR